MTTASNTPRQLRFRWLWSSVYKGLTVEWKERRELLKLVWTTREFKRRGW